MGTQTAHSAALHTIAEALAAHDQELLAGLDKADFKKGRLRAIFIGQSSAPSRLWTSTSNTQAGATWPLSLFAECMNRCLKHSLISVYAACTCCTS